LFFSELATYAGARGGQKALERQRLDPLHDYAAYHLDRRRGADFGPGDGGAHA